MILQMSSVAYSEFKQRLQQKIPQKILSEIDF